MRFITCFNFEASVYFTSTSLKKTDRVGSLIVKAFILTSFIFKLIVDLLTMVDNGAVGICDGE